MSGRHLLGNLVQEHYVRKFRALTRERNARLAALATRTDAQNYVLSVRQKIAAAFPMPQERIARNPQVTGSLKRPGFTIEKVIYESRPGFFVTANFYLPCGSGKHPGVIFLCGHSQQGKAGDAYQQGAQGLALQGYAVLCIDPAGQGERYQFTDAGSDGWGIAGDCCQEHNMIGKQMQLCGESFGAWRAFDALCGLDYLLRRQEVDPAHIGVTGNSGGGTLTSFTQALDPRFTMAAPSCYITSWKCNVENELPADVEQIPFGMAAAGCEMSDLILAYAPRPILLLGQKNDFFDPRGLKESFDQLRRVYALLGAEENIQCFIGPGNHGYSQENRCAMYQFFNRHAAMPETQGEPAGVTVLPVADLNCTPAGQVAALPGSRSIHAIIGEKLDAFKNGRTKRTPAELQALLRRTLALPETAEPPYVRVLRNTDYSLWHPDEQNFSRFYLEVEEGMPAVLKLMDRQIFFHIPALKKVTLYVSHLDAQEELPKLPLAPPLAGLDVRGIGETMPLNCDQTFTFSENFTANTFFHGYSKDYHYASLEVLFGSSMLARRTIDVLSAIAALKAAGVKSISLAARGLGCIPAAIAALLAPDAADLTLFDAPESWESMVRSRVTLWPQSIMHPGILRETDLPEICAAVAEVKPFRVVSGADALLRPQVLK